MKLSINYSQHYDSQHNDSQHNVLYHKFVPRFSSEIFLSFKLNNDMDVFGKRCGLMMCEADSIIGR